MSGTELPPLLDGTPSGVESNLPGCELGPAERGVPRLHVDLHEVLEYRHDVLRGQYLALCAGRGSRPLQICDGIEAMFGVLQHGESKLGGSEEWPQCEYVRCVLHQGVPEELQIPFWADVRPREAVAEPAYQCVQTESLLPRFQQALSEEECRLGRNHAGDDRLELLLVEAEFVHQGLYFPRHPPGVGGLVLEHQHQQEYEHVLADVHSVHALEVLCKLTVLFGNPGPNVVFSVSSGQFLQRDNQLGTLCERVSAARLCGGGDELAVGDLLFLLFFRLDALVDFNCLSLQVGSGGPLVGLFGLGDQSQQDNGTVTDVHTFQHDLRVSVHRVLQDDVHVGAV
eukprot:2714394-Prymnesium_polylepis.2